MDASQFKDVAAKAKDACPVSRLYKGAEISLDAELEG